MNSAWRKLEAALAELNQLARAPLSREAFAHELTAVVATAISADEIIYWFAGARDLQWLASKSFREPARDFVLQTLHVGHAQRIEQANTSVYLEPIRSENEIIGILEVHQTSASDQAWGEAGTMFLASVAQIAGEFERNLALREWQAKATNQAQVLTFTSTLLAANSLGELAYIAVNDLRRMVSADRVTLFQALPRTTKVLAISGLDTFEIRSPALNAWQRFVTLVGPTGESYWQSNSAADLPTEVEQAIAEVRELNHAREFGLLPLFGKLADHTVAVGHVSCEWFTQLPDDVEKHKAIEIVPIVGPHLLREARRAANPLTSLGDWWVRRKWMGTPISAWQRLGQILLACLFVIGVGLIPVPFNIEATGELMPQERQHLFAPADGIVREIVRKAGDYRQDEIILSLENKAWELELKELHGQRTIIAEQLQTADTERLQHADGAAQANNAAQLSTRIEQLKSKQVELDAQWQMLVNRQTQLDVTAPISGAIITWDWERQLVGRPVKRGEQLCTLANLQGEWHVEIRIPADDVYYVTDADNHSESALLANFRLGHDADQVYQGHLQIFPRSLEVVDNQPPMLIGKVSGISPMLLNARPGAAGKVNIACGRKSLAFVWLRPLWEFIRESGW